MNQHTPGPWHVGMCPGPMIYDARGGQVADMRADLLPRGERVANVRLIAAAPDLLDALAWLDDVELDGYQGETIGVHVIDVRAMLAAVAKARHG